MNDSPRHRLGTLTALIVASCATEPQVADRDVAIGIATTSSIAELDPRFLSIAVDSSQFAGTEFWNEDPSTSEEIPEVSIAPYDFERPRLSKLVTPLAPAFLRIGGTHADHLYYDLSDAPVEEARPPYRGVLTKALWDPMADFAKRNGLSILFTLNAARGPRDPAGAWTSSQARSLMDHARARRDPVAVWEFGNELNAYRAAHGFTLDPEQMGADLVTLARLRDELFPSSKIAGPSVAYWPEIGEFVPYMQGALEHGGHVLDIVTWHYYPQQSDRCPLQSVLAGPEVLLDPIRLDEFHRWAEEVESTAAFHAPQADIWLGETGNAQCGGAPGVSDRFAGTFWWLDQLGAAAQRGQGTVVRQTLSGSDYGLLRDQDLEPRPDYWATVLFKRLMGTTVLKATSAAPSLRTYAHCGRTAGITLVAINLSRTARTRLLLPAWAKAPWSAFVLQADALTSADIQLNGETLRLDAAGNLPPLLGKLTDDIVLAPRSIAFIQLPASGICDKGPPAEN